MAPTPPHTEPTDRAALRKRLLAQRLTWAASPDAPQAQQALQERLRAVLAQLEPTCLGVFWPVQGEFNPWDIALAAQAQWDCQLALPFACREPVAMHFRQWDGQVPDTKDDCGMASTQGKPVVPDVVLVPCVGFAPQGWRLGYGGGYFDRYLAAHPEATAIGVAWDIGQLDESVISPRAHDQPLVAVITESRVWSA